MTTAESMGMLRVSNAFHAFPRDSSNVIGPYTIFRYGPPKPGQCSLTVFSQAQKYARFIRLSEDWRRV